MYLGNEISVDVMHHAWERKLVHYSVDTVHYSLCAWRLKASQYFIQEFEATDFNERNKNQTE